MCAQLNGGEVGRRCVHILVPEEVQLYPVGGSSGFYSHQGITSSFTSLQDEILRSYSV